MALPREIFSPLSINRFKWPVECYFMHEFFLYSCPRNCFTYFPFFSHTKETTLPEVAHKRCRRPFSMLVRATACRHSLCDTSDFVVGAEAAAPQVIGTSKKRMQKNSITNFVPINQARSQSACRRTKRLNLSPTIVKIDSEGHVKVIRSMEG